MLEIQFYMSFVRLLYLIVNSVVVNSEYLIYLIVFRDRFSQFVINCASAKICVYRILKKGPIIFYGFRLRYVSIIYAIL